MNGFNIQKMMKQAQQMQKQMESTQEELAGVEMTGVAGGGVITVEETIEMLEDLVSSAIKDANSKVNSLVQDKMGAITGGMNLNIPGLF
jgi:hypothetical protein